MYKTCAQADVEVDDKGKQRRRYRRYHELNRELECRGLRFVRYADDCNIYVRSERAGQRVMTSITRFITQKLKLKVNETKSAVARPQERKFLGFSFTHGPQVRNRHSRMLRRSSGAPSPRHRHIPT